MKRLLVAILAVMVMLITANTATAQGPSGSINDNIVVNDRYVLPRDHVRHGNLTVFAREVELEPGSRVDGNLSIVASGKVVLNGEINGNVSVLASNANLSDGLRINGNLSICVRHVEQGAEVVVMGNQSTGCDQLGAFFSGKGISSGVRHIRNTPYGGYDENPIVRIFRLVVTACALAALAALIAVLFPRQLQRITETAMSTPVTTGAVGFVSMGVALAITAVYLLSIVLTLGLLCLASPVFGAAWLVVWLALLAGWIAISVPVGSVLLHRMRVTPTPITAAALGTLALTLTQGLLEMLPCIGWISWLLVIALVSVGFGAVVLTRFGTRPYPELVAAHPRPTIV